MSWEIITKEDAANFARITTAQLQDIWYDVALAAIENYTGWQSLTEAADISEYIDGPGSSILVPRLPINTVSLLQIYGSSVPTSYYYVTWNGVEMRTYRPGETYETTVYFERVTSFGDVFPFGIRNIYITYNYGGIGSLPNEYLGLVKDSLLQVIKEFSVVPRSEGSDTMLKKYRPDRTLQPEEILSNYGIHGKIKGILQATLPRRKTFGLRV